MKTIEDIERYLRSKDVSDVLRVKIRKIAEKFEEKYDDGLKKFFSKDAPGGCGPRSEIEGLYVSISEKSKKKKKKKFWDVYDMAFAYFYGRDEEKAQKKKEEKHEEEQRFDKRLLKMHSYDELKSIVDMMEFCNISELNFLEIAGFLENVRFRKKSTNVAENPASGSDGALNAEKQ